MPLIPELGDKGKWMCEFQTSPGYIVSETLSKASKQNKTIKKQTNKKVTFNVLWLCVPLTPAP